MSINISNSGRKRIVVSGASGLLGSRFLDLLRHNYEIHALIRGRQKATLPEVIYHQIDLALEWSTEGLPDRIDAVLHLAQSSHAKQFPEFASDIYQVNTNATVKLLDYARRSGASHFVLTSTGGLYAPSQDIITEDSPVDPPEGPLRFYFDSKLSAELVTRAYEDIFNVTVLRPFFIYGSGQNGSMLISRLIKNVRTESPTQLTGEEGIMLNPIYVDDAVIALDACLQTQGSFLINVAGPQSLSLKKLCYYIGKEIGKKPVFQHIEQKAENYVTDISKLRALIGDREMYDFSKGISRIVKAGRF